MTDAERMVRLVIAAARKRLWIANAYFTPPNSIMEQLVHKAHEGVDVRVLAPGPVHDVPIVRASQRSTYERLLEAGVRIWEYQASMMHAKTMLVDDWLSVVGSTNMDALSLNKLGEGSMVVADQELNRQLERGWEQDFGVLAGDHPRDGRSDEPVAAVRAAGDAAGGAGPVGRSSARVLHAHLAAHGQHGARGALHAPCRVGARLLFALRRGRGVGLRGMLVGAPVGTEVPRASLLGIPFCVAPTLASPRVLIRAQLLAVLILLLRHVTPPAPQDGDGGSKRLGWGWSRGSHGWPGHWQAPEPRPLSSPAFSTAQDTKEAKRLAINLATSRMQNEELKPSSQMVYS